MISNLSATIQRTQEIASVVPKISQSGVEAASKRKEFAEAKLQELLERSRILLLFGNTARKGHAAAATQLAKELVAAVKEYNNASDAIEEAGGTPSSLAAAVDAVKNISKLYTTVDILA